jgi:dolichol-phosphate mannosyltransferase
MTSDLGIAPELSVVVPVYNEEPDNLRCLIDRVDGMAAGIPVSYELIFVNDGSSGRTSTALHQLAVDRANVRVIVLSRNFGECAAICAGMDHARGDVIVNMDSDLQDPPELIPVMLDLYRKGYDIVFTRQATRQESVIRRWAASFFYRLLWMLSHTEIPIDVGEFRLMSRRAIKSLRTLPEKRRFLRGLVPFLGFRQTILPYDRQQRRCGQSEYTLPRLFALALEGVLCFSFSPIILLAPLAVLLGVIGIIFLAVDVHSMLGWMILLSGLNIFALAVVGAYVAMTLTEVRGRPTYIVSETIDATTTGDPTTASLAARW